MPPAAVKRRLNNAIRCCTVITEGERNEKLFRMLCKLINIGATAEQLEELAVELNMQKIDPPLDDEELALIITSARRYC